MPTSNNQVTDNSVDYSDFNARQNGTYEKTWKNTNKCVFCDLRDKYIIKKGKTVVLTVNLFPYIDGHLMVIPYRHIQYISEFTKEEYAESKVLIEEGISVLKDKLQIDDVWVIFRNAMGTRADKTVTHAHVHLIPYVENLIHVNHKRITIPPVDLAQKLKT